MALLIHLALSIRGFLVDIHMSSRNRGTPVARNSFWFPPPPPECGASSPREPSQELAEVAERHAAAFEKPAAELRKTCFVP